MRRLLFALMILLVCLAGCRSVDFGVTISDLPAFEARSNCTDWLGGSLYFGPPEGVRRTWFTGLNRGWLCFFKRVTRCVDGVCRLDSFDISERWDCVKRLHVGWLGLALNINWQEPAASSDDLSGEIELPENPKPPLARDPPVVNEATTPPAKGSGGSGRPIWPLFAVLGGMIFFGISMAAKEKCFFGVKIFRPLLKRLGFNIKQYKYEPWYKD